MVPLLLHLVLTPGVAHAQDGDRSSASATRSDSGIGTRRPFGLGLSLGAPTAISGKLYLQERHALDMAFAIDLEDHHHHDHVYAHAVYLWHPSEIATEPGFDLGWHVGVGGVLRSGGGAWRWADHHDHHHHGDDPDLGVRVPIGLDLDLKRAPVQFFGDLAADVYVVPTTAVDLGAALGARVYF